MAQLVIAMLDMSAVHDAMHEVGFIGEALAYRHGSAFRALDKRLADLMECEDFIGKDHPLPAEDGECAVIFTPSATVTEIIRDARALGIVK